MTPLLCPVWCQATARSFSRIMIEKRGRARKISRAAAKPTMPAPMIATSYVMRGSAIAGRNLPSGRAFETHGLGCAAAKPSHRPASVAHVDCLLFSSTGRLGTAFGGGVKQLTEICKSGGIDVRDRPVFGAAIAPDLNGIAVNRKSPSRRRAARGQGGEADEMLLVPVDQDRRGRAGDDVYPASGKRKTLRPEIDHFWRKRETRRKPRLDRVAIGRRDIGGPA